MSYLFIVSVLIRYCYTIFCLHLKYMVLILSTEWLTEWQRPTEPSEWMGFLVESFAVPHQFPSQRDLLISLTSWMFWRNESTLSKLSNLLRLRFHSFSLCICGVCSDALFLFMISGNCRIFSTANIELASLSTLVNYSRNQVLFHQLFSIENFYWFFFLLLSITMSILLSFSVVFLC